MQVHLAQSKLARILLSKAEVHPLVTLALGHECTGVSEHASGVTVRARRLSPPRVSDFTMVLIIDIALLVLILLCNWETEN